MARPFHLAAAEQNNIEIVNSILRSKDHYQTLGVSRDCNESELKNAFKKLTLALHPSGNDVPGASEAFDRVAEAFRALTNTTHRAQHDHDTRPIEVNTLLPISDRETMELLVNECNKVMLGRWSGVVLEKDKSGMCLILRGNVKEDVESAAREVLNMKEYLCNKKQSDKPPSKAIPAIPTASNKDNNKDNNGAFKPPPPPGRKQRPEAVRLSHTEIKQESTTTTEAAASSSGSNNNNNNNNNNNGAAATNPANEPPKRPLPPPPPAASKKPNPEEDEKMKKIREIDSILKCRDYYQVLGVNRGATRLEIKENFKRLALQLHPDKNNAPNASEAFKVVSEAFRVLSDDELRANHDQSLDAKWAVRLTVRVAPDFFDLVCGEGEENLRYVEKMFEGVAISIKGLGSMRELEVAGAVWNTVEQAAEELENMATYVRRYRVGPGARASWRRSRTRSRSWVKVDLDNFMKGGDDVDGNNVNNNDKDNGGGGGVGRENTNENPSASKPKSRRAFDDSHMFKHSHSDLDHDKQCCIS